MKLKSYEYEIKLSAAIPSIICLDVTVKGQVMALNEDEAKAIACSHAINLFKKKKQITDVKIKENENN